MSTTNGTMNKPKLELLLDKPIKLTLLKDKPYIGNNNYGEFYLYSVKDENGIDYSYFSDAPIHQLIQEHKMKAGSSFVLQRVAVMNGKKMGSKVEFSIIGDALEPSPANSSDDGLKNLLLQCVKDAATVLKEAEIQASNDDLLKLAITMLIQRSRNA